MDTRDIGIALSAPSDQEERQTLLESIFPEHPTVVNTIEAYLEPTPEAEPAAQSRQAHPPSAPLRSSSFSLDSLAQDRKKEEEEEEEEAKDAQHSFSLSSGASSSSKPALELILRKIKVANLLRTLVKGLPDQFRVRRNDQLFDRSGDAYRKLFAQRFDFHEAFAELADKFLLSGLDITPLKKAREFCTAVQESIEAPQHDEALPESALLLWVNQLVRETEEFCDALDREYLLEAGLKPKASKKDQTLAELDAALYEQHLNFCGTALTAIACKDFAALTSIALEYASLFNPKPANKVVSVSAQKFKAAIMTKMDFTPQHAQIGLKLFCDTLRYAQTQDWDGLLAYILSVQPEAASREEKEREEKFGPGLQQHHLHAHPPQRSSSVEASSLSLSNSQSSASAKPPTLLNKPH